MRRHARHRQRRGQALLEISIILPVLVALVAGGAQVAYIAYAKISVDTAAREGARTAVTNPQAINPVPSCPSTPPASGTSTGNPVCDAVYRSAGLLSGSNLRITVVAPDTSVSRAPGYTELSAVIHEASSTSTTACNGEPLTGSVTPVQVAHITDTSANNTINKDTLSDGTFTLCFTTPPNNGNGAYTDTVYFTASGCSTTQTSVQVTVDKQGTTPSTLTVTLNPPTCSSSTTSSSTTTATTTATSTASSSSSTASTITSSTSSTTCSDTNQGRYVTVTVSYDAPIFVPLVGRLFSSSGTATVTATVTMRIESCDVTGGPTGSGPAPPSGT